MLLVETGTIKDTTNQQFCVRCHFLNQSSYMCSMPIWIYKVMRPRNKRFATMYAILELFMARINSGIEDSDFDVALEVIGGQCFVENP